MLSLVRSAAVSGIEGYLVAVELDMANGLPTFCTVGLPDCSVREARERVVSAVRNSGFEFPSRRVTVNLAPARLRKAGTHFDLAIAIGVLLASGQLEIGPWPGEYCFVGELSLDGALRPVCGVLPMAAAVRAAGLAGMVLPAPNAAEAQAAGVRVIGIGSLKEAAELLRSPEAPVLEGPRPLPTRAEAEAGDLSDVRGQSLAKRALEVAAAGGHNMLMVGPPGSGKSMLARRLPGLLPSLDRESALEVTKVFSVCGLLPPGGGLLVNPPFRAPHHTASMAAFVGGGIRCRPGELSLAHRGVLFLDELPEFPRAMLEALRQPLEERRVCVVRARESAEYPAEFVLVAAMNPCPCGFLGRRGRACRCSAKAVERYRGKISGPLLDRIDLQLELSAISFEEWAGTGPLPADGSSSARERVACARARALERGGCSNAAIPPQSLRGACRLDRGAWTLAESACSRMNLSARSLDRLLRVARTIADLGEADSVDEMHIAEALLYRLPERPLEI